MDTKSINIDTEDNLYNSTVWLWEMSTGAIQVDILDRSDNDAHSHKIATAELNDAEALRLSDALRMAVLDRRARKDAEAAARASTSAAIQRHNHRVAIVRANQRSRATQTKVDATEPRLRHVVRGAGGEGFAAFFRADRAEDYKAKHCPGGMVTRGWTAKPDSD